MPFLGPTTYIATEVRRHVTEHTLSHNPSTRHNTLCLISHQKCYNYACFLTQDSAITASSVTAIKERYILQEPSVYICNMEHSHSTEQSFWCVAMTVQPAVYLKCHTCIHIKVYWTCTYSGCSMLINTLQHRYTVQSLYCIIIV